MKNIEIWVPAFFKHNNSSVAFVASVVSLNLFVRLLYFVLLHFMTNRWENLNFHELFCMVIWIIQTSFKVRDAFTSATLFYFYPIEIWFGNFLVKMTFEFDPQKAFANLNANSLIIFISKIPGPLLATKLRGLSTRNFRVLMEGKRSSLNDLL